MGDRDITRIRPENGTVCTEPPRRMKRKMEITESLKKSRKLAVRLRGGGNSSCVQIISSRFQNRSSCLNHSICCPLLHSNTRAPTPWLAPPLFAARAPFLEQRHPCFEGSNLLGHYIIVYAPSLQPTRAGAPSSARSFGLSGFEWLNDGVVKFGQDVGRKRVDLEFDLLGALGTGRVYISNWREDLEIK